MGCSKCARKQILLDGYINKKANFSPPYNASDISVYDNGLIRAFDNSDWNQDRYKLLLFYPETNTPVCESEMGALNNWIDKFNDLNCDVFSVTTDHIGLVKQWYEEDDLLKNPKYKALSSYHLPSRIGILNGNRAKRASVIITPDSDVIVIEHFMKVGRNIAELHRTIFAHSTGSYCGEGWTEGDEFLNDNN